MLALQHAKHPPPVKSLLRLFHGDWDWYNELIAETLGARGDSGTLGELLERYAGLQWHARLYVSGVFEKLVFPEHEQGLLDALNGEEDPPMRVDIARTMLFLGTEPAVAAARRLLKDLSLGHERADLADPLLIHEVLTRGETPALRRELDSMARRVEAEMGFEPMNNGFANRRRHRFYKEN